MSDMRSLATAVESYAVDNNNYPAAACPAGSLTGGTFIELLTNSFTNLAPTYIANPPRKDGWSRGFAYRLSSDSQAYAIRCKGRDGNSTAITCGTTTNFNDDILYSNGTFLQWPEGTQD